MSLLKIILAALPLILPFHAFSYPIYEAEILGDPRFFHPLDGVLNGTMNLNESGGALFSASHHAKLGVRYDSHERSFVRIPSDIFYQSLSETGIAVGAEVPINSIPGAVRIEPNGTYTRLAQVSGNPDHEESVAIAINSSGISVGAIGSVFDRSPDDGIQPQAFLWDLNNNIKLIGTGSAVDITDAGLVLGTSDTASVRDSRGAHTGNLQVQFSGQNWLWTETGGRVDLGISGGFRINEAGQILGSSGGQSFLFDLVSGYQSLGFEANDLNDHGQVVGGTTLWDPHFGELDILDLLLPFPDPLFDLSSINDLTAINNTGQILTSAIFFDPRQNCPACGYRVPILLNPVGVPEPGTWLLLGTVLAALRFSQYFGRRIPRLS